MAYIDNIQILQAIDERQQQNGGRPLWVNAYQLLAAISGTHVADPQLTPGFLQELFIAHAAGHLTWRPVQGTNPQNADYYLQQIQELALTPTGQDRARNRVVILPPPDPKEDDGYDLSDLVVRQVAEAIAHEYAPDQVTTFLAEQGIPPEWLALPDGISHGDAHAVLATVWRAGSLGRRLVRRFLGHWLDGQLITGPDGELRAALVEQLARQGWQIRPDDSVLVAAEPVRGIPVSTPFLREARLHPLIEAEARPQFMIRKLDQAVLSSLRAVEIRVRALGGFGDQLVRVYGSTAVNTGEYSAGS